MSVVRKRGGIYGGYDKKNMKRKDKKITKFSVYNSMNFALLVIFEQTNSKKKTNKQTNKNVENKGV